MYKTFDVKLKRVSRGSLNVSHAPDWAAEMDELNDYITSDNRPFKLQFFDPERVYAPVSDDILKYIREHRYSTGSDDNFLCSSEDDADSDNIIDVENIPSSEHGDDVL